MSTTIAFTPDPAVPFLRHDPDMQVRDAFVGAKVITLNADFDVMGSSFPDSTQVLLKRLFSSADLVEGAVYLLEQQNVPGYEGHAWYNQQMMGRLQRAERVVAGQFPSAELFFSFDHAEAGAKLYGARPDGLHFVCVHFDKPRITKSQLGRGSEEWAERKQKHRCQLWQVTNYITPPTSRNIAKAQYATEAGIGIQQQQWLAEEKQIASGEAVMVTARSQGFDYPPTLEQQLDSERASLVDRLLNGLAAIPAGRAHRSKGAIVALTRRNHERSVTEFYLQEAIYPVLDLLDSMHCERAAMAAFLSRIAEPAVGLHAGTVLAPPAQARLEASAILSSAGSY